MEDRHIFKFWIALGLIVAIFFFCFGVRTFAYDDIPLEFNWIYKKNNDSSVYTWNNGYASNVEGLNYIGMECGIPVPHYAGDGQYSLYFHFKFTCDQDPKPLFRMVISPYDSALSLYPSTSSNNYLVNQLGQTDLFGELNQYNANLKNYWGTFRWMSKSSCSFNWVCMREKSPDYSNQYTYSVVGVMDLRLMEEDEMAPFRLGIEIANAQSYNTYTVYNVDMGLNALDSSETWALYDIWTVLDEISLKLDNLSVDVSIDTSEIERLLNNIFLKEGATQGDVERLWVILSRYVSEMMDYNEVQTDPDITEWGAEASAFESKVDELYEIEESMIGSLASFEFPTAGTYTEVERSFFDFWFLDPLLTPMILTGLALMIAFLIL